MLRYRMWNYFLGKKKKKKSPWSSNEEKLFFWIFSWQGKSLEYKDRRPKIYSHLCHAVICFQIQEIFPLHVLSRWAWERESEKDGWYPRTTMAGRLTNSFNTGWKLSSSRITAIIQTCEKCWTSQSVVFSGSGWTGGLPYGTFPMDISTTQTAAWEAGEPFLGMRGSNSFRGMEGFKEKRGERSFKTLWRLAAVGRAAVFPKAPLTGKTVSFPLFFFPLHKSNVYPTTAKSTDLLWTPKGVQIVLLSPWNTPKVAFIKHTPWQTSRIYKTLYRIPKLVTQTSLLHLFLFFPLHLYSFPLEGDVTTPQGDFCRGVAHRSEVRV